MLKDELIQNLLNIAQEHESRGDNGKGADIRALVAEVNSGKRDHTSIQIKARIQLDKFDGEATPGKSPVETKEFITNL